MPSGADALKHLSTPFVDTRTSPRRAVALASLDDLSHEVDRIEAASKPGQGLRVTGNWSAGQILDHLARTIERTLDGFTTLPSSERPLPSGLARLPARAERARIAAAETALKSRLLSQPMQPCGPSAGLPGEIEPWTQVWTPDGAARLRTALGRIADKHPMLCPSPTMGRLTADEWARFHLRHAELHLSFVIHGEWR